MNRSLVSSIAVAVMMLLPPGASAQDQFTVTTCPGGEKVPIPCEIDCSHLKDPQSKAHCEPFITNQACKLYPAYRKITNVVLEKWCKSVKYTIYDPDSWPKQDSEAGAGGMTRSCSVDYLAKYSVDATSDLPALPTTRTRSCTSIRWASAALARFNTYTACLGPARSKP